MAERGLRSRVCAAIRKISGLTGRAATLRSIARNVDRPEEVAKSALDELVAEGRVQKCRGRGGLYRISALRLLSSVKPLRTEIRDGIKVTIYPPMPAPGAYGRPVDPWGSIRPRSTRRRGAL